jgi:hypothetical protein
VTSATALTESRQISKALQPTSSESLSIIRTSAHAITALSPISQTDVERVNITKTVLSPISQTDVERIGKITAIAEPQVISRIASVSRLVSIVDAESVLRLVQVNRTITATESEGLTVARSFSSGTHPVSVTISSAEVLSQIKAMTHAVSIVAAAQISVLRRITKGLLVLSGETLTAIRRAAKFIGLSEPETILIGRAIARTTLFSQAQQLLVTAVSTRIFARAVTLAQASALTITKQTGRIVVAVVAQSFVMVRSISRAVIIANAQALTRAATRFLTRPFSQAQSLLTTAVRVTGMQTVILAIGQHLVFARTPVKAITFAVGSQVTRILGPIARAILITTLQAVSVAKRRSAPLITVASTELVTIARGKSFLRVLLLSDPESLILIKQKTLFLTVLSAISQINIQRIAKTLLIGTSQQVIRARTQFRALLVTTTQFVSSVQIKIAQGTKLILIATAQSLTVSRGMLRLQTVIAAIGQLISIVTRQFYGFHMPPPWWPVGRGRIVEQVGPRRIVKSSAPRRIAGRKQ